MRRGRLGDYVALLRDGKHTARTVAQNILGPVLASGPRYRPGDTAATLARYHPHRIPVVVTAMRQDTPTTRVVTLAPRLGTFPPFFAGQYVNVFLEVDGVQTSRPYSISSPPSALDQIELTVRVKPGGFVSEHLVRRLEVGARLDLSGPAGDFHYNPLCDGRSLVFIAGGSGIAPCASIIQFALTRRLPLDMLLIYGSRNEEEVILRAPLERLAEEHDRFRLAHVLSEPARGWKGERGLLDEDCLRRHLPTGDPGATTFFVCGPPQMCALSLAALAALGIPRSRVRLEAYGPPDDITKEPGWPADVTAADEFKVTLAGRSRTIPARAGEPLMAALERNGVILPSLCRSGVCATCRTRLIDGRVFHPDSVTLRESDRSAGYIHPCMSYPTSDLVLALP